MWGLQPKGLLKQTSLPIQIQNSTNFTQSSNQESFMTNVRKKALWELEIEEEIKGILQGYFLYNEYSCDRVIAPCERLVFLGLA